MMKYRSSEHSLVAGAMIVRGVVMLTVTGAML